jgi:hypothetical protein
MSKYEFIVTYAVKAENIDEAMKKLDQVLLCGTVDTFSVCPPKGVKLKAVAVSLDSSPVIVEDAT